MKPLHIKVPVDVTNIDSVMEVEAEIVPLFPWVRTVIHKHVHFAVNQQWVVAEVTTGACIASGNTREEAIRSAVSQLALTGEAGTKDAIKTFIATRQQYNR